MSFNGAEFGQYPQDWSIGTLGECIEVLTDYHANGAYKKLKENVELLDEENYSIMIRTTNFEQNDFSIKSFKYINEHAYNFLSKTKVYQNDILMNKIANAGNVYLMPKLNKPVSLAMNLFLIRFNENVIMQKYAYYFMKNYEAYIKTRAQGSVTKTITKENVRKLEIAFPDIEEQTIIVKTLSDIDEKIETNNQINKKLEEMAQVIFKQWFADFEFPNEDGEPYKSSGGEMVESEMGMIPKGWKVSKLSDIIYFNPRETLNKVEEYAFVEMASLDNSRSSIKYWEKRKLSGGSRFRNGDTLLARITPCLENGKTAYVDILEENEVAFGSTEFIVMREMEVSNKIYIYCLARENNFRAHAIKSMSGSSGRQRVQLDLLKNYPVVQAPKYIYDSFGKIGESLFEKISSNNKETARLIRLRDNLLPKLMSGEIRVPLNN